MAKKIIASLSLGDVLFSCMIQTMRKYRFKAVDHKGNKLEGVGWRMGESFTRKTKACEMGNLNPVGLARLNLNPKLIANSYSCKEQQLIT